MALAASLAVTVVASQWWTIPVTTPAPVPLAASRPVQVASVARPVESTSASSGGSDEAVSDNVLYVEDTSLLSLAEQLDDDPSDGTGDSLI